MSELSSHRVCCLVNHEKFPKFRRLHSLYWGHLKDNHPKQWLPSFLISEPAKPLKDGSFVVRLKQQLHFIYADTWFLETGSPDTSQAGLDLPTLHQHQVLGLTGMCYHTQLNSPFLKGSRWDEGHELPSWRKPERTQCIWQELQGCRFLEPTSELQELPLQPWSRFFQEHSCQTAGKWGTAAC